LRRQVSRQIVLISYLPDGHCGVCSISLHDRSDVFNCKVIRWRTRCQEIYCLFICQPLILT
jgi:hypothetical protein